jgi:DNA-binding NarL/FixJ family response regulator
VRVLIVDDSAIMREHIAELLSEFEKDIDLVARAQDVPQGLEAIRTLEPDVVILDIRMPGGSGIDVLKALKRERPAAYAIMLTNYPYPQYRQRCRDAGADFFLEKSSEFDRLPEIIQGLIRKTHDHGGGGEGIGRASLNQPDGDLAG